jgi:hypothetical protein
MYVHPLKKKTPMSHAGLWRKFRKYGFLFFFFKGILWLLGPWAIYAFQ